jgi:hypothetical protein
MTCVEIYNKKTSPYSRLCVQPVGDVLRAFEDGEVKAYEDGTEVLI